jgi:hypothetical protein
MPSKDVSPSPVAAGHVLLIAAVLFCIALIPLTLVRVPPIVDYPNHMARMQILADEGRSEYLTRYYDIHWDILPNLALDVLIPRFARLVDIATAGKVFID